MTLHRQPYKKKFKISEILNNAINVTYLYFSVARVQVVGIYAAVGVEVRRLAGVEGEDGNPPVGPLGAAAAELGEGVQPHLVALVEEAAGSVEAKNTSS